MAYEPVTKERFTVEPTEAGDRIRIRASRNVFVMLFVSVWLAGWTVAGIGAAYGLATHFEPFLVVWLVFWAVFWVLAATTLAWMAIGSETLRVCGGDLEVTRQLANWSRRRLYKGAEIRHLSVAGQPAWPYRFSWQTPWLGGNRMGSFDYGARTHFLAPGLDEAEGRRIVERLLTRLPASAA